MGAVHHRFKEVSFLEMQQAPIIILVSQQPSRRESVNDGSLEYEKIVERYLVEKCHQGNLKSGAIIEVFYSHNARFKQFAKDLERGISRHSVELSFKAPESEYSGDDERKVLLLNLANKEGIFAHMRPGLILHAGWWSEFESA